MLYVAGRNEDRIKAHRGGILRFITRNLDPTDPNLESKVLVRIRVYDRDDQLVENYGYENLDLNAPLVDADFDPKNPEYHF